MLPWLIAYALLLPLPFILSNFFNDYLIDLANRACLFIMLAVGLNIVKGFCGQVTVGHIGLYAIGAVTSAVLSLEPGGFGGALGFGLPVWVFPAKIGANITTKIGLANCNQPIGIM